MVQYIMAGAHGGGGLFISLWPRSKKKEKERARVAVCPLRAHSNDLTSFH
jgi:hypothetical protein